ncbi:MAG: site-specific integrase [Bacilli bacterium]|nr:site-specific integrase [Bacilli bacterium]
MTIRQVPKKQWTKDKRSWVFDCYYKDIDGNNKRFNSKKYASRKEAYDAETQFRLKVQDQFNYSDITFNDLVDSHYEYQKDKVKATTLLNYRRMRKFITPIENIKVAEFNIRHYEMWKKTVNQDHFSTRYKNTIYKYLKAIMNYGTKWYEINFNSVYNKMTNFNNPNERKKEMKFFTIDEFHKFLAVEDNFKYRCLFQTLFYCGLRKGEIRGLTWNDINFNRGTLTVNKNVVCVKDEKTGNSWTLTSPKTMSSYRTLPIPKFLLDNLDKLYLEDSKYKNFNNDWYIFGDINPLANTTLIERKKRNINLAGVKYIRLHDFRHSCASLLIDSGANITLVAKYLGHTKIDETLNTYSHMYQNRLDTIVNIIEQQNEKYEEIEEKSLVL